MERTIKRFEIYWINMDPTVRSEIKKTRPCIIVSPDELNQYLQTVIVIPLTSHIRDHYEFRPEITCQNIPAQVATDQIRTIDKSRLGKKIGNCTQKESEKISEILMEMFQI